jgi:pyruvate dehydrogenase E2 component (dihydrolipoamide acetyltransferase)
VSVSVVMPQLGESVTEGTVTRWLKKEGEHVTADEPLLEVSTDKVDTEIPSPGTGILREIAVDEDETVAVGARLAVIEESNVADAPAPSPAAPEPTVPAPSVPAPSVPAPSSSASVPMPTAPAERKEADAAGPEPTPAPSGGAPYVPPPVRQPAAEAAPAPQAAPSAPVAPSAPAIPSAPATPAAAVVTARAEIVPSALRGTTQRLSRLRQVIAKRMVESLQTSAQLTTVVEADVTGIARLRDRAKDAFLAREGVKLTFLPFFAQAAVEALKVHPALNAVINPDTQEVTYHAAEHLGIAVDTDRGLMVPNIHNAGDLNIGGLARKIADLANRTRSGQVSPDELAGGTFTLTNTGSRGALFDTPIINQPQTGILGAGSVVKRPVVVDDPALGEVIAVRSMVYLALTYDHRLVDGADAARFLTTVKNRLEEGAFEADLGL